MAHGNQFSALRLLEAGADKAACDLIRDSDKTRHSDVMEAVSRNRTHPSAIDNLETRTAS